jgi:hypothetical protein
MEMIGPGTPGKNPLAASQAAAGGFYTVFGFQFSVFGKIIK